MDTSKPPYAAVWNPNRSNSPPAVCALTGISTDRSPPRSLSGRGSSREGGTPPNKANFVHVKVVRRSCIFVIFAVLDRGDTCTHTLVIVAHSLHIRCTIALTTSIANIIVYHNWCVLVFSCFVLGVDLQF